jgi:hypothetical protein
VHNAAKLLGKIRERGYSGGVTRVRAVWAPWRRDRSVRWCVSRRLRASRRRWTGATSGNWDGRRLYGFALTLCWSRMRYVEFTQRQDAETLLNCIVHALEFFGGVTQTVLTDNMKTVVVDRVDGQPCFHPKMLDFASYYGFVPPVCRPYRPETKGKIESTIRFIKGNFWPGIEFDSLSELNRQAIDWCGEVNRRVPSTTREIPQTRFAHEGLTPLNGQPAYDTQLRESSPGGQGLHVQLSRQPLLGAVSSRRQECAGARAAGLGHHPHYGELPRRSRTAAVKPPLVISELSPGPGVGVHYAIPEVELRPLAIYNACCEEVAHVASV